MTFDEIIYKRLTEEEDIASALATYAGKPAVFYQTAPDDKQAWGKDQYPRIVFTIDLRADQERKTAGVLQADLYCDESHTAPEQIAPHIRDCLTNLILKPDGSSHYAFAWASTEMFYLSGSSGVSTRIDGATIRFDILEYGDQYTSNPDPAEAVLICLKSLVPDGAVIGIDKIAPYYEPSGERPAFYVRINSHKTNRQTYAITWVDCTISVHVITADSDMRMKWVRFLSDYFNRAGEVGMTDGSPMLIFSTMADNTADYLSKGQITLNAQYSLPRVSVLEHPLNQTGYTRKFE